LITIAPVGGSISAAPTPWSARAAIRKVSDWAKPQAADEQTNSTMPVINTPTRLNMSASRPPTATSAASDSR
jgi:hypothetical protein